jgi:hypothetical protein
MGICGAASACEGSAPGTDITHCGCGNTYFADNIGSTAEDEDNSPENSPPEGRG